jgi:hypothetical protein
MPSLLGSMAARLPKRVITFFVLSYSVAAE